MSNQAVATRNAMAACNEDYAGLWLIARIVREAGLADEATLMEATLNLLTELLELGNINAGQFQKTNSGTQSWSFEIWKATPRDIISAGKAGLLRRTENFIGSAR